MKYEFICQAECLTDNPLDKEILSIQPRLDGLSLSVHNHNVVRTSQLIYPKPLSREEMKRLLSDPEIFPQHPAVIRFCSPSVSTVVPASVNESQGSIYLSFTAGRKLPSDSVRTIRLNSDRWLFLFVNEPWFRALEEHYLKPVEVLHPHGVSHSIAQRIASGYTLHIDISCGNVFFWFANEDTVLFSETLPFNDFDGFLFSLIKLTDQCAVKPAFILISGEQCDIISESLKPYFGGTSVSAYGENRNIHYLP